LEITEPMPRPSLDGLPHALTEVATYLDAANAARGDGWANHEGGDVGHATQRAVARHTSNYLAVAELSRQLGLKGALLDVGSGTGGLAAWVADRLGLELHLVDRDPAVRRVAEASFPGARVHGDLDEVGPHTVALVTAMEVLEHVEHAGQSSFLRRLAARVDAGGLLVVSTPDETRYLGRWSGYAPHIGPVDARRLERLLTDAGGPGADVAVWRLEGDPFHLGKLAAVTQPIGNRVWTVLGPLLRPVTHHLVGPATAIANFSRTHLAGGMTPHVRVVPAAHGIGTGLLGVVRMPA
jgi:hypothetical protein